MFCCIEIPDDEYDKLKLMNGSVSDNIQKAVTQYVKAYDKRIAKKEK